MSTASPRTRHHAEQNNLFCLWFTILFVYIKEVHTRFSLKKLPLLPGPATFSDGKWVVVLILLSLIHMASAENQLQPEMHEYAMSIIQYVYKDDFESAEIEAKKMIRRYPDHPAPYFFAAIAADAWMAHYWSKSRENEFYKYCDLAISKGEELLERNRNDEWAKFFIAGSDGYKGTYEARFERWITAFRYGWQGVSKLIDMESAGTTVVDVNYGIGSYDYWRSAMIQTLWFMPKVDDRRQKGIDRLYMVKEKGVYTKDAAAAALVDILLNEKKYEEALILSDEMLKKYPNTQLFLMGKAKALFGLENYEKSTVFFELLQKMCQEYKVGDSYMVITCHFWLAKNYLKQKDYTRTMMECNRMTYYKISGDTRKMLEKYFSEAESIKKAVYAAQKSGAHKE
jgi:tetratricopeptide (TPR) repeat protein